MSWEDFHKKDIAPEKIESMKVFKGKSAIEKYGEKGANGVIEVTTKGFADKGTKESTQDTAKPKFERVFTRVENPPYYSKGMTAFAEYIQSNMQYPKEALENKKEGAVSIQFIIDEDGKLSDFKKVSDVGFGLEEEAIRLIKNSTDWKPGIQNGHKVPVQIIQQIIFRLPGKKV
ncbi:MAG: TonB family protein [Segetibacter sp.]